MISWGWRKCSVIIVNQTATQEFMKAGTDPTIKRFLQHHTNKSSPKGNDFGDGEGWTWKTVYNSHQCPFLKGRFYCLTSF